MQWDVEILKRKEMWYKRSHAVALSGYHLANIWFVDNAASHKNVWEVWNHKLKCRWKRNSLDIILSQRGKGTILRGKALSFKMLRFS